MRQFERFWEVRGRGFSGEEWELICAEVNAFLKTCPVPLVGAFGSKPEVSAFEISLNGKDGAEPFFLYRAPSGLNSCNTEGKPYDQVVVSVLAVAKKVSSDIIDVAGFLDQTPLRRIFGSKWKKGPKGWNADSKKKYWNTMVGDSKHPVTVCMDKMEGKVTNTGAFCGALSDQVRGKGWRSEERG